MYRRIVLLIMDSVGAGQAPDANRFGDEGANTLQHIDEYVQGMNLPHLFSLGLGNILPFQKNHGTIVQGAWGKMQEISAGKDTTSGHWEMMGHPIDTPFPVFPHAFPEELMERFIEKTGHGYLGNEVASGTEIIERLGKEHLATGHPIVYTSADSVFQIAAHEDILPLKELYRICEITRNEVCVGPYEVGRIIARPFIGELGSFVRTANRHDYSRMPNHDMVFTYLQKAGYAVHGFGKIGDIYAHVDLTTSTPTKSNHDGMTVLRNTLATCQDSGLYMINLVDFDSLYGHRRDPAGYAARLEELDRDLALLIKETGPEDLLLLTADHGNDPTFTGTDHTREYVPLLAYAKDLIPTDLGIRQTFADIGQTILHNFAIDNTLIGTSFLSQLRRK